MEHLRFKAVYGGVPLAYGALLRRAVALLHNAGEASRCVADDPAVTCCVIQAGGEHGDLGVGLAVRRHEPSQCGRLEERNVAGKDEDRAVVANEAWGSSHHRVRGAALRGLQGVLEIRPERIADRFGLMPHHNDDAPHARLPAHPHYMEREG